jgi:uncharacterized protein YegP (UPF0339 family)
MWAARDEMISTRQRRRVSAMAGRFELYPRQAGTFRLKAASSEIIASSDAYESETSAKKGIDSVRKNALRHRPR